jgi:hypothetical protein
MKLAGQLIRDAGFLAEIRSHSKPNVGALSRMLFSQFKLPLQLQPILTKGPFVATDVTNRNAPGSHSEHD